MVVGTRLVARTATEVRTLDAGMSDHLPKPLDFERIAATVRRRAGEGESEGATIN